MHLTRRTFMTHGARALGGAALAGCVSSGTPAADRPNIILCMTDDQGWGDTGYNGHPVLRTPHLDRMAREGLRFERFYAAAPVCSPTRGSCLTGRHPYRYGITSANVGAMKAEEITLAEVLRAQGYATGHFGKWHLGTLTRDRKDANRGGPEQTAVYAPPWEHGFDTCFSTESKVPTFWHEDAYRTYGTHYWTGPGQPVPAAEVRGDDSRLIMDRALPFVRTAVSDRRPFLAVIWFHAPHLPVLAAPPHTDGYREHPDYYGCLTAMDEQVGRLRAELQRLGIAGRTLLWFCSDNGPEGTDRDPGRTGGLRGRKRSLYEGGIRVPGLLVWPDVIRKPRTVSLPCFTSDIFPTVLDLLGHRLPEAAARPYDGLSLLPLIRGAGTARPRPMAFESGRQLAIMDLRYKLYSGDGGATFELYDLETDPGERTNLAGRQPDRVRAMAAVLADWRRSCRDSAAGRDYAGAARRER